MQHAQAGREQRPCKAEQHVVCLRMASDRKASFGLAHAGHALQCLGSAQACLIGIQRIMAGQPGG